MWVGTAAKLRRLPSEIAHATDSDFHWLLAWWDLQREAMDEDE